MNLLNSTTRIRAVSYHSRNAKTKVHQLSLLTTLPINNIAGNYGSMLPLPSAGKQECSLWLAREKKMEPVQSAGKHVTCAKRGKTMHDFFKLKLHKCKNKTGKHFSFESHWKVLLYEVSTSSYFPKLLLKS